tara:strand:+ start:12019 stop:12366 length:348 start_codon:yes stop_codon:yes gene_type:complete
MNKHIELVKKWLDDKDSVTANELRENAVDAYYVANPDAAYAYHAAAAEAVYAYDVAASYHATVDAYTYHASASAYAYDVAAADDAAAEAYTYNATVDADEAASWVAKYEKLTGGE